MKAMFVWTEGKKFVSKSYDNVLDTDYEIVGYTENCTEQRNKGILCHRAELDNQPIFKNFVGPMWDYNCLRYETEEVYRIMSTQENNYEVL